MKNHAALVALIIFSKVSSCDYNANKVQEIKAFAFRVVNINDENAKPRFKRNLRA